MSNTVRQIVLDRINSDNNDLCRGADRPRALYLGDDRLRVGRRGSEGSIKPGPDQNGLNWDDKQPGVRVVDERNSVDGSRRQEGAMRQCAWLYMQARRGLAKGGEQRVRPFART